jgi:hypothetical protein
MGLPITNYLLINRFYFLFILSEILIFLTILNWHIAKLSWLINLRLNSDFFGLWLPHRYWKTFKTQNSINIVNLIWNNKFSKNFSIDEFMEFSIIYNVQLFGYSCLLSFQNLFDDILLWKNLCSLKSNKRI